MSKDLIPLRAHLITVVDTRSTNFLCFMKNIFIHMYLLSSSETSAAPVAKMLHIAKWKCY